MTLVSSVNCSLCNVSNKYNSILSNTNIKLNQLNEISIFNQNCTYELFQDSCFIQSESIINSKTQKNNIHISKFKFKAIESAPSGYFNSNLIDGLLGLNYNNNSEIPNNNIIWELYNEGYISSPSFSIIITSSNINRLYLGDIMKNEYVQNYIDSSMNKGECKIIDNNWSCKLTFIEYNTPRYIHWKSNKIWHSSIVRFNTRENKLTIPDEYYNSIVVGYNEVIKKNGRSTRKYKKMCYTQGEIIYCSCYDKDDFGIITFHFKNNSKLDIDLRDYVYYDKSAFYFKCKVDIILSEKYEFIVGLKGLNNTILSFNLKEEKIKFFHKKKYNPLYITSFFMLGIIFIIALIIALIIIYFRN